MLKKLLVVLGIIMVLGLLWGCESTYTRTATVINNQNNLVTCQDMSGNVWQYKGNNAIGEQVKLIMNDNHTSKITDDIIKEVK